MGEVHKLQHMPVRSGTIKQTAYIYKPNVHIIIIFITTTDFTNFELFFLVVRALKHVMFQQQGIEKSVL
jgi:hypothetical protein